MPTGRYIFLAVGAIMAISGVVTLFRSARSWTRSQEADRTGVQQRFIGRFLMANALLHIGMLIVTVAGAGLIVFGLQG